MADSRYSIGVDLGGSNIAVGLVDLHSRAIIRQYSVKTNAPRSPHSIAREIKDVALKLCRYVGISLKDVSWIGVATLGIVKDGVIVSAINLGFKNVDFRKILSDITSLPVYLANDANAAAYAEAIWGVGKGARSLVAITLGTGVGGGIVIDGKIWEGTNGFAAEIGHTTLVMGGEKCSCGRLGCLEAYASAPALIRESRRRMQEYKDSIMWKLCEGNLERVGGKTPFKAKEMGDECAGLVLFEYVERLSVAIANVINIFQPDVVCIGGGISREGEALLAPLRKAVLEKCFGLEGSRTLLTTASFKNDAGIIGAVLLGLPDKKS